MSETLISSGFLTWASHLTRKKIIHGLLRISKELEWFLTLRRISAWDAENLNWGKHHQNWHGLVAVVNELKTHSINISLESLWQAQYSSSSVSQRSRLSPTSAPWLCAGPSKCRYCSFQAYWPTWLVLDALHALALGHPRKRPVSLHSRQRRARPCKAVSPSCVIPSRPPLRPCLPRFTSWSFPSGHFSADRTTVASPDTVSKISPRSHHELQTSKDRMLLLQDRPRTPGVNSSNWLEPKPCEANGLTML